MDTQLRSFIQAAQGGDLEAFGAIVKRFQVMACATAYAMLNDAGLAEDVAQEAFIEAYQNLPKLREIDAFPGWFRRIIFKQGDRLRRGKRLLITSLEASEAYDRVIDALNPAAKLESSEQAAVVQRA